MAWQINVIQIDEYWFFFVTNIFLSSLNSFGRIEEESPLLFRGTYKPRVHQNLLGRVLKGNNTKKQHAKKQQ